MPNRYYRAVSGQWVEPGAAAVARIHHASLTAPLNPVVGAGVLWGFNVFSGAQYLQANGTETAKQVLTRLIRQFGKITIYKVFYGASLPARWDPDLEGVGEGSTAKTVMVTCKQGGSTAQAAVDIANGLHDAAFRAYIRSIPAGWRVLLVYWQEVDNELSDAGGPGTTLTTAQYVAAANRMADVVHADRDGGLLAAKVEMWAAFMYTPVRYDWWSDSRIPTRCDGVSWQPYLNPPPPILGSTYYESGDNVTTWPSGLLKGVNAYNYAQNCKTIASRVRDQQGVPYSVGGPGGKGRWGWTEWGAPFRTGDIAGEHGRPDGSRRADALGNMAKELIAAGGQMGIAWGVNVGLYDHRLIDLTVSPAPSQSTVNWQPSPLPTPPMEPAIPVLRSHFTA